jgi:7SK snRNA methylphosphate capping enzyme
MEALLRARGEDFFVDKAVLDLGCGDGFITFLTASLNAHRVEGVDIDAALISRALKQLRHLKSKGYDTLPKAPEDATADSKFPMSCVLSHGIVPYICKPLIRGIGARDVESRSQSSSSSRPPFPYNMEFRTENVLVSEIEDRRNQLFDVVFCLRLTKWVHLHWGDDGMKVLLSRCFRLLRPGGVLVFEAQPWISYNSKKHLTPHARQNHGLIKFRPEEFNSYLVKVIGFEEPETLVGGSPPLERPLFIFRRPSSPPAAKPKTHPAPPASLGSTAGTSVERAEVGAHSGLEEWPSLEPEAKRQRAAE